MTRINVIPVELLTDQHLMAEYRELPMIMGSARRSKPQKFNPPARYTLNSGHVLFFYNKKKYLTDRFLDLVAELYARGFEIDPTARRINFSDLDKFPQIEWKPDKVATEINVARLRERILMKPHWYKYKRQPLPTNWEQLLLPL